jgi:hypothetical protein
MTNAELLRTARELERKIRGYRAAHFAASDHLRIGHYALGLLLILVSAVVSGSVLQATDGDPSESLTLAAGALSVAVVVLTSIQTTFKLGERGEAHRSAADGFGRIDRRLELFIHRDHPDLERAWEELAKIAEEVGNVESGAPGFTRITYNRARDRLEKDAGT